MQNRLVSFELKVGIFVFIGILLLFVFVFSIGEFYFFKPVYRINVIFGFANGIEIGSPVRVSGVNMGEVEDIDMFYDEALGRARVRLKVALRREARIERDAVCKINTLGLLGEKYLEITPGSREAGFLEEDGTIVGQDPIPMDEVTRTMKELSESAKELTDSANTILHRIEKGEGTIGKLLIDDTIYKNLADFTEDIKRHPWKLLYRGRRRTVDKKTSPKGPKKNF